MTSSNQTKTMLPMEFSQKLPIFQILGDQPLEKMKTPEGKRTASKIMTTALWVGIAYGLWVILPYVLSLVGNLILLGIYVFAAFAMYLLFPPAVAMLQRLVNIFTYKANKAITERYAVETLHLHLENVKNTLKVVKERITTVIALRAGMLDKSQKQNESSEAFYKKVKRLTQQAAKEEGDALAQEKDGNTDEAAEFKRKAYELRVEANSAKLEGDSAKQSAAQLAQFANQVGKGIQILKNRESSLRIKSNLLVSSVNIIEMQLETSSSMRAATQGLADILQIEDTDTFQIAMDAVSFQINDDLAHAQRSLDLLNENSISNFDVQSQEELEAFVKKLDSGEIKALDVAKVSSPYHELKKDEIIDHRFNIFD